MTRCWIYKLINTKTGMFYVGQTTSPGSREHQHFRLLKKGEHPSKRLQEVWDEQKGEGFVFELTYETDVKYALAVEQFVLSQCADLCYNTSRYTNAPHKGKFGSEHPCGGKKSEEHLKKIAEGVAAFWADKNHPKKGVPRTEKVRQKISESQIGKIVSVETRFKQSQAQLGRVWTEEEKQKLRKPKGRTQEHANKFKKAIIEVTTGQRFESLKAVKEHYGISPGFLAKCLTKDAPLKKGELKGLHFQYVHTAGV